MDHIVGLNLHCLVAATVVGLICFAGFKVVLGTYQVVIQLSDQKYQQTTIKHIYFGWE